MDSTRNMRVERLRDKLVDRGMASIRPRVPSSVLGPEALAMQQRVRPFAEAMYLVLSAERDIEERERDVLRGALRILTDGLVSTSSMDELLAEFESARARDGVDVRLDALAAALYGDPNDAELALGLMAAAAETDGRLGTAEQAIILALGERLGVATAHVQNLLYGAPQNRSD